MLASLKCFVISIFIIIIRIIVFVVVAVVGGLNVRTIILITQQDKKIKKFQ